MVLKLRWFDDTSGIYPIPYDETQGVIVSEFLCYAIYLQREKSLSAIYVKNEIHHLALFYNCCIKPGTLISGATNECLRGFKKTDLERLQLKSASSIRSLKKVVNQRLVRIYHFYAWLQHHYKLTGIIGKINCQIHSTLTLYRRHKNNKDEHNDYPLLYSLTGSSSKHATQYQATDKDITLLTEYFLSKYGKYVAQRNILIMEIGQQLSLRRSSINSLKCMQFSDEIIESTEDDFLPVCPHIQKFDYSIIFECPLPLALRINAFIRGFRKDFLNEHGFSELATGGYLFLSQRTGKPLNSQTISEIFGEAFRAIGVKAARVAIHATRRKYANDQIKKEIIGRKRNGLDTSDLSVASSVSLSMGQTDPESLRPYVSRVQLGIIHKEEIERNVQVQKLISENERLQSELKRLRQKISENLDRSSFDE